MKIAACQLPHVQKDPERALSLIERYCADAQEQGATLVCFPECFLQGYDVREEHVASTALDLGSTEFERVLRRLEGIEPVIVLGLIEKDTRKFYNTAVVLERGRLVTRYRKVHLIGGERAIFEPGNACALFDVCGVKVGMNICHDLTFPQSLEAAAQAGAELLACPCNNLLRRGTAEAWKLLHNEIRCKRARDAGISVMSLD